jgi:D-mannonate dehydratase
MKEKLKKIRMVDEDDLSHRLQEFLNEIPIKKWRKVIVARIHRLLEVSQGDGGYIS